MKRIRLAQAADDAAVSELLIRTFSHLYETMGIEMSLERRAYLGAQAERRTFAESIICEVDGEVAGTVTLVPPSRRSQAWIDGAWELQLLAVDPSMQRSGIARALVENAEWQAKGAGASAICLHARRGMEGQTRFYPSCGYMRDPSGDLDRHPFLEGYSKTF